MSATATITKHASPERNGGRYRTTPSRAYDAHLPGFAHRHRVAILDLKSEETIRADYAELTVFARHLNGHEPAPQDKGEVNRLYAAVMLAPAAPKSTCCGGARTQEQVAWGQLEPMIPAIEWYAALHEFALTDTPAESETSEPTPAPRRGRGPKKVSHAEEATNPGAEVETATVGGEEEADTAV